MTRASGVGSWPGTSAREAVRVVRDLLGDGVPHLPELPGRGAGADMVGRTAAMLPSLHVETQPYGWRFVGRPGADEGRARAWLREDLDELAEAYDGWEGPLKVQVCGPWTLLASVELTRGERAAADPGARRDVVAATAAAVSEHLADVRRLVPGARLVLQVDEPALPAVLDGRLPTASGYGRLRAVKVSEVRDGLREVLAAAGEQETLVHCCATDAPLRLLAEAGAGGAGGGRDAAGLSLDLTRLDARAWDDLAETLDAGTRLWAGVVPTDAEARTGATDWRAAHEAVLRPWQRVGLPGALLADVTVTPGCGLAGLSTTAAVHALRTSVDAAPALADTAAG